MLALAEWMGRCCLRLRHAQHNEGGCAPRHSSATQSEREAANVDCAPRRLSALAMLRLPNRRALCAAGGDYTTAIRSSGGVRPLRAQSAGVQAPRSSGTIIAVMIAQPPVADGFNFTSLHSMRQRKSHCRTADANF